MIAAVMILVFVAMSYANTVLDARLAENEFSANKQFMVTTGLQIDDVAWTVGRTQTISYSSRFGHIKFQSQAVTYTIELRFHDLTSENYTFTTAMIMYNVPISAYNLGNGYSERLSPRNDASFLQNDSTAPVSHVFVVEKLPMDDGSFIRIVAVPSIRTLTSSIISGLTTNYFKFFLPILEAASENPALSQSVTMVGNNVTKITKSNVDQITISVDFPSSENGFDSTFFGFESTVETPTLPENSVVELYVGKVVVSIGQV
jgi:hypothetical protein